MNARQKAKYWKKKYNQIANMPLPTVVKTPSDVVTLKFKREYPCEDFIPVGSWVTNSEHASNVIKHDLAKYLSENVMDLVDYKIHKDYERDLYELIGRISILKPLKEGNYV